MTEIVLTEDDLTLLPWDAAEVLKTPEQCAEYLALAVARDEGDGSATLGALEDIVRVKAMVLRAKEAGLHRSTLYRALKPGAQPSFATVLRIIRALGLDLATMPRATSATNKHAA
jgi:probable addiction module antidote protein